MKLKVLKSNKTKFPSFWCPVTIVVKGEEEKGAQPKGINVYFSEVADKKLPVGFKGGVIKCNSEDINIPFIYEIKKGKKPDGTECDDYPFIYIKDLINVLPLKPKQNTCTFVLDEEETDEVNFDENVK